MQLEYTEEDIENLKSRFINIKFTIIEEKNRKAILMKASAIFFIYSCLPIKEAMKKPIIKVIIEITPEISRENPG